MLNRTLLFGEGLFETWRVYKGRKLPLVEDHLARMEKGCQFFGWPFAKEKAKALLEKTLKEIPVETEARLRLTLVTYGKERVEYTNFLTTWQPLSPDLSRLQKEGVKIAIAPWPRCSSPLRNFKTTCFLENNLMLNRARQKGFYEVLCLNERGEITEGCISNIFFIKDEHTIITPSKKAGLLPGITRQKIIEILQQRGIKVEEMPIYPEEINQFQGAFLTNAVIEVLPIKQIEDTVYSCPNGCEWLKSAYRSLILSG
ncbi:MAG: aminotransferase class IV family protein [Candidatus Desulfofervidaceae bacterium]|nr:aminotransferase class IV family protein [Candidatus Desulfofervidaceae bacterium]